MAKNVALFGRRELQAHRRLVTGVTASPPAYIEVDSAGNKEWCVDVFIGPTATEDLNIAKACPIAPYARELVTDIKQPVLLERSKQGKYTVIGRAKVLPAGIQFDEGDVEEETFHLVRHNLADLRVRFIADLDYVLEEYQETPDTPYQADEDEPYQVLKAYDAFGNQVIGPGAVAPDGGADGDLPPPPGGGAGYSPAPGKGALYGGTPSKTTTKTGVSAMPAKYGPYGDPDAMVWGESEYQPMIYKKTSS